MGGGWEEGGFWWGGGRGWEGQGREGKGSWGGGRWKIENRKSKIEARMKDEDENEKGRASPKSSTIPLMLLKSQKTKRKEIRIENVKKGVQDDSTQKKYDLTKKQIFRKDARFKRFRILSRGISCMKG